MNGTGQAFRVAVTKGTLRIPPTYFALSHAEALKNVHHFEGFVLAGDIADGAITTPVHQFVPFPSLGFRRRELVMPAFMPAMTAGVLRFRPHIIHQHTAVWSIPAVNASQIARTPLLTTLHGADVFVYARKPKTIMQRWHHANIAAANRRSTRLLAVSKFLAGAAVVSGYPADKMEVHYQGIDADFFVPPEVDHTRDELPKVVFVGSFAEHKGVVDLAFALILLSKTVPHRAVFVGDGPLRRDIETLLKDHPHAKILGSSDREAVRSHLQEAHLVVVPSKERDGAREAAGLVALESQACGTPVVAYDSGGLSEMLRNGETGVLVSEGNTRELTDAMAQILRMPLAEYRSMQVRARDFVVSTRSLAVSCRELEGHYRDLVP